MEKRSRSRRRQPDKSLKKWILPLVFLFTVIIVGRRYMYYRAQYLKQAELDESLEYHRAGTGSQDRMDGSYFGG